MRGLSTDGMAYVYESFRCSRYPWTAPGYVARAGDGLRSRADAADDAYLVSKVTEARPVTLYMLKEWLALGNLKVGELFTEIDTSRYGDEAMPPRTYPENIDNWHLYDGLRKEQFR